MEAAGTHIYFVTYPCRVYRAMPTLKSPSVSAEISLSWKACASCKTRSANVYTRRNACHLARSNLCLHSLWHPVVCVGPRPAMTLTGGPSFSIQAKCAHSVELLALRGRPCICAGFYSDDGGRRCLGACCLEHGMNGRPHKQACR